MISKQSPTIFLWIVVFVCLLCGIAFAYFLPYSYALWALVLVGISLVVLEHYFLLRIWRRDVSQLEEVLDTLLSGQDPDFESLSARWYQVGKKLRSIATYLAVMKQGMEDRIALLEEKNNELKTQKTALQESILALEHYHTIQDKFRGVLDIDKILQHAMELLVQEMSPNKAFFLQFDLDSEYVRVRFPVGVSLAPEQLLHRQEIDALLRRFNDPEQSVIDLSQEEQPGMLYGIPFQSCLLARLVIDAEVWGVICVLDKESRQNTDAFLEKDRIILSNMASILQKDLKSAHLFELATTDSLSKLCVRRYFERRLEEEIRRSQRHQLEFSLLMIDIDYFKRFNDTYGHLVGDEVIREVAHVIKEQVRNGVDIVARYGGEEIVVLLPQTGQHAAAIVAERIRQAVEQLELPSFSNTKNSPQVTISLGVAVYPAHGVEISQLMEHADQALYRAKEGGRNQVQIWSARE